MPRAELHSSNPDDRIISKVAESLKSGAVVICPTDTLYAFACMLSNREGIEKICKLVGKKPEKANLSILCSDLKHISDYTLQFSKSTYKLLNRNLPGPFTFILRANNKVPKLFLNKRKSLGIRVPDTKITQRLIESCAEPLVCASVHHPEQTDLFLNEVEDMEKYYGNAVEWILDSGKGGLMGSAVIDCCGEEPELLREGPKALI